MRNTEKAKQLVGKRGYADNPAYREAMIQMRFDTFAQGDVAYFQNLYGDAKDVFSRNQILQAFVLRCLGYDLEGFFLAAFKKERYLDMKLTAVRGYAACAGEGQVVPLMDKFVQLLARRAQTTPGNYQEYEMLRSAFGLPYLVERYGYECFVQAAAQLEKQYNGMPDEYKGRFTLDENGLHVPLPANGGPSGK